MLKIKECYTMEAHQEDRRNQDEDEDRQLNMVIKRRRTKRPRLPSPLALGITTSSCSTVEGGELVDGHVANSSSRSNNCDGVDDKMMRNNNMMNQEEEDMANCLILLAQGHNYNQKSLDVYQCKTCNRSFPSFQALGGHRASHKKPKTLEDQQVIDNNIRLKLNNNDHHVTTLSLQIPSNTTTTNNSSNSNNKNKNRVHECSICGAEFTSGQALGGHMRRHRPLPNSIANASNHQSHEESHHHDHQEIKNTRAFLSLDLNLPAPEDDHRPENSKFTFATKEQVIVFSTSPLVDCHY